MRSVFVGEVKVGMGILWGVEFLVGEGEGG